jgi:hypothetical protein
MEYIGATARCPGGIQRGRGSGGWHKYPYRRPIVERAKGRGYRSKRARSINKLWGARKRKHITKPGGRAVQRPVRRGNPMDGIGNVDGLGGGIMTGVGLLVVYMVAKKKRWI